jgi:NTE family protein
VTCLACAQAHLVNPKTREVLGRCLMSVARQCVHHLVNLVYRPTNPEGASKDDEFSRRSIEERWLAGYRDTVHALRHPDVLEA